MTTLKRDHLERERIIRSWQIGLGVGAGVLIGVLATVAIEGSHQIIHPGSALSSLGVPAAVERALEEPNARTDLETASRQQLQGELQAVRRQWVMSQQALVRLQADRRWHEPEQREHLARAVRDTSLAIRDRRNRVGELEGELNRRGSERGATQSQR